MIKKLHFKTWLLMVVMLLGAGTAWAESKSATVNFQSNGSPYTYNGITFTWSSIDLSITSSSSLTVTLPSGTILTKIEKTHVNQWATAAKVNVYAGSDDTGTQIATLVGGTNSYTISSNNAGGTFYFSNPTSKDAWINTLTITYEELVACTVTLGDDNTTLTETSGGAGVTLPTRSTVGDYVFAGWSETNVDTETTTAPNIIPAGTYKPTANITLYPVYKRTDAGSAGEAKTVSVSIQDYAGSNNWVNDTKYTSVSIGGNVTVTAEGGGNTGKYYTNGYDWRFYQNESAKAVVSLASGTLTSVTFTFSVAKGGTLNYNTTSITSGKAVSVSGSSAEFIVGNSGTATNGQVRISDISVSYTSGSTTYYWSTPEMSLLKKTVVTVSGDLTLDLDGQTNVSAGTLTAAVTYNNAAVAGATVTWSSSNPSVATIGENTGAVTILATGDVTFTATYAGNDEYARATGTKTVTVIDSTVPGSVGNPYTVAQAIEAIDAGTGVTGVYVRGIVCTGGSNLSNDGSMIYWISDDGTQTNKFEIYYGKGVNGASFTSTDDVQVGDVVVVKGNITKYNNTTYEFASGSQLVSLQRVEKPATPTFSPAAGTYTEATNVTISCTSEGADIYYTLESRYSTGETYLSGGTPTTESTKYTEPIALGWENNLLTYTIRAIAVKNGKSSEVAQATFTINLEKQIVADPAEIKLGTEGGTGTIDVSFINYPNYQSDPAGFHYWKETATGSLLLDENIPEWFHISYSSDYSTLTYTVDPNTTTEERAIQVQFWVQNTFSNKVYFTQERIVHDYAELPFSFDSGKAAIESTDGLTQTGLGDDYDSSPKLRFDHTGDALVLKLNERPGKLTYDIKGNSFSGGTFKVQTSEDGETYTDKATYTKLSSVQSEEFDDFGENVRYIRWIYTNKSSGNVALGNISVTKPIPTITVATTTVNLPDVNAIGGTIDVTYKNFTPVSREYKFYTADGTTEVEEPEWLPVFLDESSNYNIHYTCLDNDGDARTAYLKVHATDSEGNNIYSKLITFTQEKFVIRTNYVLTTTIESGCHYIITNSANADKAMAMGAQADNNRRAAQITLGDMGNAIVTPDDNVKEVVIYGPYTITVGEEEKECYTIYDESIPGYLYAASSSSNYLRTKSTLDGNAQWTIEIGEDGVATIKAQGSNTNNTMRYNKNNSLFSCYASGQEPIYLYQRIEEPESVTAPIAIAQACTDGTKHYSTFSSSSAIKVPEGVTVSEIGVEDGELLVEDYANGAVVPANTGVMVSSTVPGIHVAKLSSEVGTSKLGADNNLRPSGAAGITADDMAAVDANSVFYRLTMHNDTQIGFWWGAAEGAAFSVAANKAYLAVPKQQAARQGFAFSGETTGMASVNAPAAANNYYNLQGQRVENPAKGLYIVNGKKVVIK